MAETGQKISALQAATSAADADVLAGVQSNATKKFSFSVILNYIKSKLTPADIGAVPNTRTVNSKALSADIALTAADVGAATTADIPEAYATNPEMDGAASAGSSPAWARGDHVHPADTSKADVDGSYRELTAGQILSDGRYEDKVPYTFRKSGGEYDVGNNEADTLVGGTVAWNQLVQDGDFASTTGWEATNASAAYSGNVCTLTANGSSTFMRLQRSFTPVSGHVYFATYDFDFSGAADVTGTSFRFVGTSSPSLGGNTNTKGRYAAIGTASDGNGTGLAIYVTRSGGNIPSGESATVSNINLFDLTQMFGATVANALLALETATPGAGTAWFTGLFPKPYYAYNAGALLSVNASAHKTVGFNACDEEWEPGGISSANGGNTNQYTMIRTKNYIRVLPLTKYYAYNGSYVGLNMNFQVRFYDANKKYIGYANASGIAIYWGQEFITPSGTCYMRIQLQDTYGTTYKHDICVNLSRSGIRNGEYEPYIKHTYPLDSDLTLRGVPSWADGKMYYDGDTYKADGTVTRRYGIVDLGALTDWSLGLIDGHNRFYSATLHPLVKYSSNRLICPKFVLATAHSSNTFFANNTIVTSGTSQSLGCVWFWSDDYVDAAAFKTAVSGVYLVYELAETTTESADPFTTPQAVDAWGTEEYVVTEQSGVAVPVGHDTIYEKDLRGKLEAMPDSVPSTASIAPTENGDTASRAYAQGKYFFRNGDFCKALTAISAGASFTLNTNYAVTTVADELYTALH